MKACFELNDNLLHIIRRIERVSFTNIMIFVIHKNALEAVNY